MPKIRENYEYARVLPKEIWRFYMDYYRQVTKEGQQHESLLFDIDEPGYMAAMLKAHQLLNITLHEPLSPKLILQLYKAALEGVSKTNLTELDRFDRFRSNDVSGFWLKLNTVDTDEANVSREGLRQFLEEIIANNNENHYEILSHGTDVLQDVLKRYKGAANPKQGLEDALDFLETTIKNTPCKFLSPRMTHKEIAEKINHYILQYEIKLKSVAGDENKIDCIINLIQKIERLHPFIDGNCRTLVMLVLNRELIRNGFKPTMLWNPNRFDFFSTEQLREDILKGWTQAEKYQSEVANLMPYQKLYNQVDTLYIDARKSLFHKSSIETKARDLEKLLETLKTTAPQDSIELIRTSMTKLKIGRGVDSTENLLKALLSDIEKMPSLTLSSHSSKLH
ncbi:Fic family protein [Legionella hackeliae]|uniref:Fido domain-containing protein n=1 Tax=Legionella hackeliae TaxID=449 RepID=A0A0A8UP77_LEGHA|nr:Fic family protein [Legionella hackeliae]KTD13492.1 ankyrin repeat-containing protein [Legionella hackeliae]CEK09336.1 protein of unknown function [Legionella hackeliae]STX49242.1 ankyrin repeat-containing protein [Legionella hackeliae]